MVRRPVMVEAFIRKFKDFNFSSGRFDGTTIRGICRTDLLCCLCEDFTVGKRNRNMVSIEPVCDFEGLNCNRCLCIVLYRRVRSVSTTGKF